MCVVPTVNSGGLSLISKMDTVTVVVPLAEEGRQEQKVHQPVLNTFMANMISPFRIHCFIHCMHNITY